MAQTGVKSALNKRILALSGKINMAKDTLRSKGRALLEGAKASKAKFNKPAVDNDHDQDDSVPRQVERGVKAAKSAANKVGRQIGGGFHKVRRVSKLARANKKKIQLLEGTKNVLSKKA